MRKSLQIKTLAQICSTNGSLRAILGPPFAPHFKPIVRPRPGPAPACSCGPRCGHSSTFRKHCTKALATATCSTSRALKHKQGCPRLAHAMVSAHLTSRHVMVSRETGRQTLRTQWFGDSGTPPSRVFDWRGGPNLGTPGRQTLYMCWFPLFVPYDHASTKTSRAAKSYICASSAFGTPHLYAACRFGPFSGRQTLRT